VSDLSASEKSSAPDMTDFLASSVHDMKNSVSLLISGLEKTLSFASPETMATYGELSQMTYEAKRINHNLVQLLTLYKLDQQIYPFDPQYISLDEFLQGMREQAASLLRTQNIELELGDAADLYWPFDEDLIMGVIGNALSNAIRYTKHRVRLAVSVIGEFLEIRIEDDGRGYSPEMIEQTVAAQRGVSFQTGSTGLGLYFSTKVAQLHHNRGRHGEIRLENGGTYGGGCFIIRLP
jgi:two-component system, OmpR family, sensor histidine kinase SenX3